MSIAAPCPPRMIGQRAALPEGDLQGEGNA
jgi:hypothetical protein